MINFYNSDRLDEDLHVTCITINDKMLSTPMKLINLFTKT
jgi:hypothetical protein